MNCHPSTYFRPIAAGLLLLFLGPLGPLQAAAPADKDAKTDTGSPGLPQSSYNNTNNRPDPFWPVKRKSSGPDLRSAVNESELHLKGILWHPTRPVAIINRQPMALNETVTLKLSTGDVAAKAISIERDRVVLMIAEHRVELQLER